MTLGQRYGPDTVAQTDGWTDGQSDFNTVCGGWGGVGAGIAMYSLAQQLSNANSKYLYLYRVFRILHKRRVPCDV